MSRFVSAGAAQEGNSPPRSDEWAKVQQELDAKRQRDDSQSQAQDGGKSLYEVLQANRAAKQEKFEEANRLKNQFRSLDDDEVEFLDSVLETTRAKDEAIRQETQSQLERFRQRQGRADNATDDFEQDQEESWSLKRKRKKSSQPGGIKGLKLRRSSSSAADTTVKNTSVSEQENQQQHKPAEETDAKEGDSKVKSRLYKRPHSSQGVGLPSSPVRGKALGLANYSSEDD